MKPSRLFLIVLLLLSATLVYGQLKYENPVWIKNNTAGALTNVQVMLRVNTQIPIGLGWMQADGRDIRFTAVCDGMTYLAHWIEGYLNTDSTIIWVEVPSIGANASTLLFMY